MAKESAKEYASSLADLTMNSKPMINMLTILAEENIDHAEVIVETVEKHLEKVQADVKLPVLYLVDSIIKNVGGAYTQKFSNSIVNMFTKTFKQVDEKTRSQMFRLRETWHDVFPATKLYQLDVKVNLIDPAWPIQAQPQQSNIHVNPNFLKKPAPTTSAAAAAPAASEEGDMMSILAKKEQELLMLQKKKIEMELEATRRKLEIAERTAKKTSATMGAANAVPAPYMPSSEVPAAAPVMNRLGPPVNPKAAGAKIAPASGAMVSAVVRRDPRLARAPVSASPPAVPVAPLAPLQPLAPLAPAVPIAPNVFDIQPLPPPLAKRKNVLTIDVRPDIAERHIKTGDPRRRDPRLRNANKNRPKDTDDRVRKEKRREDRNKRIEEAKKREEEEKQKEKPKIDVTKSPKEIVDSYINKLGDPKKINKLPPIPKLNKHTEDKKDEAAPSPTKRRKESARERKNKKTDGRDSSSSESLSPEKRSKVKEPRKEKRKEQTMEVDEPAAEEVVAFKELKNFNKERYRRNRDKSKSPEKVPEKQESSELQVPDVTNGTEVAAETKDVDLRVLQPVEAPPAPIIQKRSSTDSSESKSKKSKLEKFDILFGNEDVDLRQLPAVEDAPVSPRSPTSEDPAGPLSPVGSPKEKDWNAVKDKVDKRPSKLDLVRAKLAEATGRKDRLGRPYRFSKSPSVEKSLRNSLSSEDTDLRVENDDEVNKETISLILSQAKEHFKDGKMDKNQYNTLMFQVMQLNEKLKLKEAKQRESLEISKRKLHKVKVNDDNKVSSPKSSPGIDHNRFGDIDERIPPPFVDAPPNNLDMNMKDSDMRFGPVMDVMEGPIPCPPMPPMFMNNFHPNWRGPKPPREEFNRRGRNAPFQRGKRNRFDNRYKGMTPKFGMYQGDSPIPQYIFCPNPPPLGHPGVIIPETDFRALEFIEQDPMKTIEIDGVPREIRFYGDTAVIMLDWDDPREIRFLPGSRRINFDNKDSVVLNFNEGYKQVEIDDQIFDIRYGAPTRELYINDKWYETFFGGPPTAIVIDGRTRLIQLEGPAPQVDIGKDKRTDLVAGKINLILDAQHMFPIFLDAKPQKFVVEGQQYTLRFVDGLRTLLINEQPFLVEFGGLPRPIFVGRNKHFIRFSVLPRNVKPGFINIVGMEGVVSQPPPVPPQIPLMMPQPLMNNIEMNRGPMEMDVAPLPRPEKIASPEESSQGGLDMLASLMPTSMAPASSSAGYSVAEPLFNPTSNSGKIPGLETPSEEKPPIAIPALGNINDLFAKLVATGIIHVPETKEEKKEEVKEKKEDKTVVHKVDLLKPETLKKKQPALIARLYGGMQCSGCGARFPPEHTVRYSQHLDWHFRQNRRERDSARRAHSRHWHYDLADWVQYEEIEDLEEREKSWFETGAGLGVSGAGGASGAGEVEPPPPSPPPPSVPAAPGDPIQQLCALCGDRFHQFYNEDQEEWHLRQAVRHGDSTYHPLCYEDYKASLAKEPESKDESLLELIPAKEAEPSAPEPIVLDADNSQSDDDDADVVEVPAKPDPEPVVITELMEEDDDDEDAVIVSSPPIEQVDVHDGDTDDETAEERRERDRLIDFTKVKIKQEPKDPDDEPIITAEEEAITAPPPVARAAPASTIDGNIEIGAELDPVPLPSANIRINITKVMPTPAPVIQEPTVEDQPPPPGECEEVEPEFTLKETMKDVEFSKQPPVRRGDELSGLCSIM